MWKLEEGVAGIGICISPFFQDEEQRQKLNRITHPEIYKEMIWEAVKCAAAGHQYIVMDLPLLFEAGVMVAYMHKIIVVTCEEDLQVNS